MKTDISIISIHSISAADNNDSFANHNLENRTGLYAGHVSEETELEIENLKASDLKYKQLDKTVLFTILCARKAFKNTNWSKEHTIGINIGSSRGQQNYLKNTINFS